MKAPWRSAVQMMLGWFMKRGFARWKQQQQQQLLLLLLLLLLLANSTLARRSSKPSPSPVSPRSLAEMSEPFHRDESSRLRANSGDRTMHAAAGSTFHRGILRSRTDAPLSGGFGWISTEEPRKTGADAFDPEHEGESGGGSDNLELVVDEEGKAAPPANVDRGKIGSIGAGAVLAAGAIAALFDAVLSFFGYTATATVEGGLFGVDDGKYHRAFVDDIFTTENEEDAWSKGHYRVEEEGAYGKRGRMEVSGPTDRAPTAAPASAPFIPPAGAGEWPRSEALRRPNEGAPMPQAAWGPWVLSAAAAVEGGTSSAGADIGASRWEAERLTGAIGDYGGGFPAGRRVLQELTPSPVPTAGSPVEPPKETPPPTEPPTEMPPPTELPTEMPPPTEPPIETPPTTEPPTEMPPPTEPPTTAPLPTEPPTTAPLPTEPSTTVPPTTEPPTTEPPTTEPPTTEPPTTTPTPTETPAAATMAPPVSSPTEPPADLPTAPPETTSTGTPEAEPTGTSTDEPIETSSPLTTAPGVSPSPSMAPPAAEAVPSLVTPSPITEITPSLNPATTATAPPSSTLGGETPVPSSVTPTPIVVFPPTTSVPLGPDVTGGPSATFVPVGTTTPFPIVAATTVAPQEPSMTPSPSLTLSSVNGSSSPTSTNPIFMPLESNGTLSPSAVFTPSGTMTPVPTNITDPLTPSPSPLFETPLPLNNSDDGTPTPEVTPDTEEDPSPAESTPAPTAFPTNATVVDQVLIKTGEAADNAVAVAVASAAAAVTVSAATATSTTATAAAATTAVTSTAVTGAAGTTVVTSTTATGAAGTAAATVTTAAGASGAGGAAAATTTTTTATNVAATATGTTAVGGATTVTAAGGGTTTVGGATTTTATATTTNTTAGNLPGTTGMTTQEAMNQAPAQDGPMNHPADTGTTSSRSPSSTLGILMIFQLQFLSSLRMLEANISGQFLGLLDKIKWLNLHFDAGLGIWDCQGRDGFTVNDNDVWAFNTFVVFGCLILLTVSHILLISFMQASWLSQSNAIHRKRLKRMKRRSQRQITLSEEESKWLDEKNADRDLDEQEATATERFLRRHNSAWVYFPHIELVYLLFAYQGATAAEARMLYSGCPTLMALGAIALFVFPAMMIVYVGLIVWKRVKPRTGPVSFEEAEARPDSCCWCIDMCRGFYEGLRGGHSIFQWADKGEWRGRDGEEETNEDLDGRKFRIGFEPLFVDFTREGAVYIVFLLVKWFILGITEGLVTNGTIQTTVFVLLYIVDIVLLLILRPFSNAFIQWVETILVAGDAFTLLLMVYASILHPRRDGQRLDIIYATCLVIQTLVIIFVTIPIYVDTFVVLFSTIRDRLWGGEKMRKGRNKAIEVKGSWSEMCNLFCVLVRENFRSIAKATIFSDSTVEAIRKKHSIAHMNAHLFDSSEDYSDDEELDRTVIPSRRRVVVSDLPRRFRRSNANRDDSDDEELDRTLIPPRGRVEVSDRPIRFRRSNACRLDLESGRMSESMP